MTNILVTGGQGQIGRELARCSWPANVRLLFPTRHELDIGSDVSVAAFFASHSVAAVINTAAYTAVDNAERERDLAFRTNDRGPALLAEATRSARIPLVHLSTDYVFDGSKDGFYEEDDAIAPLGVYGASKAAGEKAALGNPHSVVLRTAWLMSVHRNNFLKTMLRVGSKSSLMRVVDDQIGCPTSARDVAASIKTIVLRLINDPAAPTGIFHFVNAGEASWYRLAREIFKLSAASGGPSPEVEAITTAEYPTPTRRPANSRLATSKITALYGISPRDWRIAVRDIMNEFVGPLPQTGTGQ